MIFTAKAKNCPKIHVLLFFFTNITSMNGKCLNANLILLITSLCGAAAAPLVRVEVPGGCWSVRQPVEVA
jgi:hypothetical protein